MRVFGTWQALLLDALIFFGFSLLAVSVPVRVFLVVAGGASAYYAGQARLLHELKQHLGIDQISDALHSRDAQST